MAENGVRDLVRECMKRFAAGTVVDNKDVYAFVCAKRPGTPEPTIREALQALSAGSSRENSGGKVASKVVAVAATLPELKGVGARDRVYLAIPEIERNHLGRAAALATEKTQARCAELLGKEVVDFWLKKTQLQCMPARAAREVRAAGECRLCRFLADRYDIPMPDQASVRLQAAHLAERKNAFWRIIDDVLPEENPHWLFTCEGAQAIRKRLQDDVTHSSADYMILLCKKHDDALQASLNPRTPERKRR